ncbi:unnamed protein product [Rhizoctonia solani]|uniref:F-box domain-containing protein n=1 Tax=Rhizoctonia solani TaxID=456999 RepID=A0A8H2XU01_9AGAM|nr:unnamed protein product [Rhizoctonia solani]
MPPEVFNKIASCLLPVDVLSLARSNIVFRNPFTPRASQHLWKHALEYTPDIPPCPPELSEPHVSLLFSKTCSVGLWSKNLPSSEPISLRSIVTRAAMNSKIVELPLFNELFAFLPKSIAIKEPRPGFVYVLQNKFLKIKDAAKENPTDDSFADWQTQRVAEVKARQEHGESLEDYLDMMEEERERELADMKHHRQTQYVPCWLMFHI